MGIGLTLSIEMLIKTISEFNPEEKFEIQLTNAEMIREAASVIANTSEEEIIDLKERKKRGIRFSLTVAGLQRRCRIERNYCTYARLDTVM